MKKSLLAASLALAVAICLIGIVPLANAAAGDSTIFFMTKSAGAVPCLNAAASGRGTISDLGPVQNMHVEVSNLPADAVTAGCPGTVTPFDGDHNAGIQVLHTVPAVGSLGPLARIK